MDKVIAHCEVAGRPVVELRHPEAIRAKVGEVVVLRFVYHVHERSRDEDRWRFTLTARRDNDPRTEQREHRDHFMVRDLLEDSLAIMYVFQEAGDVEIPFEAVAEMRSTPWVDDTVRPRVQRDRARGVARIRVEA